MKAYGYVCKIEQERSFVYFPATGIYAAMNYVKCNSKDVFEFDKTQVGFENPKKCEELQPDYGKIIEKTGSTLKIKMQNLINYTLPIHFFIKTSDEIAIGKEVKILKNKQGVIIYAEILEDYLPNPGQEEEVYPETISSKLPFKSMKNLFKFNEKIKESLTTVQHLYSSYRKIRGDGNCYYRAVAFAYIEGLCRPSSSPSRFVDFIHTSSEDLKPVLKYLFQVKMKLGSASDYCEEIFMNPENDLLLVKDLKSRVANHLQHNPEKFAPFLLHSLEEEIKNILELGREAEGIPCNFMPEILGVSIHNILLDREGIADNKLDNQNSSTNIYLCLRTGHYDLLYSYTQDCEDFCKVPLGPSPNLTSLIRSLNSHIKFLYEKLFTLSTCYEIRLGTYFPDTKLKIADFWQEYSILGSKCPEVAETCKDLFDFVSDGSLISELLGLCSFCLSRNSDFKLFCGHLMCRADSLELLEQATGGLCVVSEGERNKPQCIMCSALLTTEDLQKILGKEYGVYEENMKKRMRSVEEDLDKKKGLSMCKSCLSKKKISEFNQSHMCVCNLCIEKSIQNGLCKFCSKKFSKDYLKSLKLICSLCEGNLQDVIINHQSHSVCHKCEKGCLESGKCLFCSSPLTDSEIQKLSQKYLLSCFTCSKYFDEQFLKQRKCGCLTCDTCHEESMKKNSGCCGICGQRLEKPKSQCIICTDSFSRDEMLTLNCDHYFCSNCLNQHIKNSINQGQEMVTCPSCQEAIDGLIIHSLVTEQLWDIYNKASIRKHFKLVDCPKCNSNFETQQKNAKCLKCKFNFCVACKETSHQGGCDDQKIKKIISELESRGERVSQCPGCKIPYTKDEGCEHVACTNPQCNSEFCFTCSCHRSPTLIHGNHYHREDCKFYGKYEGPDKYSDKCKVCLATGQLCKRPKRLKVARRFQQGET